MLGHCAISECPISALPEAVEAAPGGGHGKPTRRKKPRAPRLVQTTHPDRRFVKGQIVAASPGDSNGDRWIDIEVTWTAA